MNKEPLVYLALVGAALLACKAGHSSSGSPSDDTSASQETAIQVPATKLMADYKGNEVRGDGIWKGKLVQVTGIVGDIKKDILDHPYVILGTGAMLEIPAVQCTLAEGQEGAAARLSKGQTATFKGHVKGLLMNVQVEDCVQVATPSAPAATPQQAAAPAQRPAATPATRSQPATRTVRSLPPRHR